MPQYMWEGIFSVLNVLVPGIIMALFAAYYQNRRKREIRIEGKLAIDRIDGYEQILKAFFEAQELQDATLEEEERAKTILQHFDVATFHFEYPRAFADEASFNAFYDRLCDVKRNYQIYLDDKVSRQIEKSLALYSHLKLWLDAFCDTEHAVVLKVQEEKARKHIDWMYKLTGMMMFSHCIWAYGALDKVICRQLSHFSLTYRKHRVHKWLGKIGDRILFWIDNSARKGGLRGKIGQGLLWLIMDKRDRSLSHIMETMVQVMRFVHFSDDYEPQEFFEMQRLPNKNDQELWGKVFKSQIHGL